MSENPAPGEQPQLDALTQPTGVAGTTAPSDWTRFHPISPLLGVWGVGSAFAGFLIATRGPQWLQDPSLPEELGSVPLGWTALAALGGAVLVMIYGYISWYFTTFKVDHEAVHLRKGVLFKSHKQARLDRLQAIDVVQPLLARLTGFAALNVEVAGGTNSTVVLSFLRLQRAHELRREILDAAAGRKAARDGQLPATPDLVTANGLPTVDPHGNPIPVPAALHAVDPAQDMGRDLYRVPTGVVIRAALLGVAAWAVVVIPVALIALLIGLLNDNIALLAPSLVVWLPIALGLVVSVWSWLNNSYNFVGGISEEGIRLRHGLLETRKQTVPPGRVQGVLIRQPLWWRHRDWWTVRVNVAGYGALENQSASVLLPVGSRNEAYTALWMVMADIGEDRAIEVLDELIDGSHDVPGFVRAPRQARWLDPIAWGRLGYRSNDRALFIRSGRLTRRLVVVPHERTQSLNFEQGPLQRKLGLATVNIHSTPGEVIPTVQHLSLSDAQELVGSQADRSRIRRHQQTPDQWLATVERGLSVGQS